jgi:hypothetical protein
MRAPPRIPYFPAGSAAALGELRDAWFVRNHTLFQLTLHAADEDILDAWSRSFLPDDLRVID